MSSIFPLRDNVSLDDEREPRLVEIDEDTADEVFEALSSQTTRKIFLELHSAPQTASDLADVTETSVQNVQYHLEKLLDADLVEVVDTWYSERGSEMKVYAPQDESLVLFAGRDKQRSLRSLLSRVMGVLGVLVPTSAAAGWITSRSDTGGLFGGSGGDGSPAAGGGGAASDGNGTDADAEAETRASDDASIEEEAADGSQPNGGDAAGDDAQPNGGDGGQVDGDGMEDATDQAETAAQETPDVEVTTDGNETFANADGDVAVATDGGMTPDGAFENAADAAEGTASIDPALAAAVAFFLGGLFVFLALSMWYGTPDSWG